jgi:hypothetical protein
LLDEVPTGELREAAAQTALQSGDDFWIEKAQRQIRLADYRLVFRSYYYTDPKGPLPLPSKTVWNITLDGKPQRQKIGSHDYVAVDYSFETVIVTDTNSSGAVEPALAVIGGRWSEPLIFPVDPDLLFERTGYSCMDEAEFPPGSVFEENTWYYYDQTCAVETLATSACHITQFPQESCTDSLKKHVGSVSCNVNFKRIPYDSSIAAQFRVGTIVNPTGADLAVVQDQLADEEAVFYRYFDTSSCEIDEGSVGAPGVAPSTRLHCRCPQRWRATHPYGRSNRPKQSLGAGARLCIQPLPPALSLHPLRHLQVWQPTRQQEGILP